MRRLTDLLFRLKAVLTPRRLERQLDDEVAFHLEMETRKLVAAGMNEADAAREARRRFGGELRQKERVRESWGIGPLQDLLADVRNAVRQLRRHPAFSGVAVLTLALGIGATVALFSVVRGLLLRPLPYADEDRVVVFWSAFNWRGIEFDFARERLPAFEHLAAYSVRGAPFRSGGGTAFLTFGVASADLFDVLGTRPALGRTFAAGEDRPGAEPVIVLSHGLWMQEFGGDPAVLGRRIDLGGEPTTVIGIMPEGFYFPTPDVRAWRPVLLDPADQAYEGNGYLVLVGRIRPEGGSAADRDIAALAAALGDRFEYPASWDKSKNASITPVREYLLGDVRPALLLLLGAVVLLLVMACTNAAALILGRTTDRAGEMAVRAALGAGRWRLARQVLVESVVLAAVAGIAGAALAFAAFDALVAALPLGNGFAGAVTLDWSLFAAAFGLALAVGLLVATLPIRGLLRGRLAGDVRSVRAEGGVRSGAPRAHRVLVTAEVVLAVTLVTGAALLIRSVDRLQQVDLGIDPEGVVTADLMVGEEEMDQAARRRFLESVVERAARLPGVEAAGLVVRLPIRDGGWQAPVSPEGRPDLSGQAAPNAMWRSATPGYFRAVGIELVRGRLFDETDRAGTTPVTVVSESFAQRLWPDTDPVGQRVQSGFSHEWVTVVGVMEEARMFGVTGTNTPVMYVPLAQAPFVGSGQVLVLRGGGGPGTLIPALRRLVADLAPGVAVWRPGTMHEVVQTALAEPLRLRFFLLLFAALALALGTVGVYGVVSYAVTRRRAEFGIRMALGAAPADVLRTVVRHGMAPVALGVVGGLVGAVALARVVERFLYGVAPTDPASLGAAGAVLLLAGGVAALVPAIRAGRVSPVEALRAE